MTKKTKQTLDAMDIAFRAMQQPETKRPNEFTAAEYKEQMGDQRHVRTVLNHLNHLADTGVLSRREGIGASKHRVILFSTPTTAKP